MELSVKLGKRKINFLVSEYTTSRFVVVAVVVVLLLFSSLLFIYLNSFNPLSPLSFSSSSSIALVLNISKES